MQATSAIFTPELVERLRTGLFRHVNYKAHRSVADAAKSAAAPLEVSYLVGRYCDLSGMAFRHGCIDMQALYQQAVRDVVGDERQFNGFTLLYGDFGGREREALGMDLNGPLLAARGGSRQCDDKQRRDEYDKN
jgi:hypothetical protein